MVGERHLERLHARVAGRHPACRCFLGLDFGSGSPNRYSKRRARRCRCRIVPAVSTEPVTQRVSASSFLEWWLSTARNPLLFPPFADYRQTAGKAILLGTDLEVVFLLRRTPLRLLTPNPGPTIPNRPAPSWRSDSSNHPRRWGEKHRGCSSG